MSVYGAIPHTESTSVCPFRITDYVNKPEQIINMHQCGSLCPIKA